MTGKRDADNAQAFMLDLRDRVLGRPQLSTDGFTPYRFAVAQAFGPDGVDYGMVVKEYETSIERQELAKNRYTPGRVKSITREAVYGNPDLDVINSSYVERSKLTFRMSMRRFTRLTNGHSKKLENHCCAVATHAMVYNFVRVHQTLRTTPAVAAGLASRPWSLAELVAAALAEVEYDDPEPSDDFPNGVDVESKDGEARDGAHVEGRGFAVDALAKLGVVAVNDNVATPIAQIPG